MGDERQHEPERSRAYLDAAATVSNWGRWGDDDEVGTLNLITAEKRRAAASLVKRGAVFSLALPLDSRGPQRGGRRSNPLHVMTRTGLDPESINGLGDGSQFTDDMVVLHLQSSTQWDALAHVYYDGELYNGFPAGSVDSRGARHCGIDRVHDRFVSRGVLLDVARLHDVTTLPPGHAISADELDRAAAAGGVAVEEGDIVLVRTGLMATWHDTGRWDAFSEPQPGLHHEVATWLHERGVAAVAADNLMVEAMGVVDGVACPLHMLALRDMGLCLGEFWDLEELAADCAADGVHEFMLVAQALPFTGAVGSPVNPLALK